MSFIGLTDYPFKNWESLYNAMGNCFNCVDSKCNLNNFYEKLEKDGFYEITKEMLDDGLDSSEGLCKLFELVCLHNRMKEIGKDLTEIIKLFMSRGAKIDTTPIFKQAHKFEDDINEAKGLLLYAIKDIIDTSILDDVEAVMWEDQDYEQIMKWQKEQSHQEEIKKAYLSALKHERDVWIKYYARI